ncbi:DNA-binding prophage protein [Geodermatophilus ruber]|uniref:DNA-binding prophage protein n=2 Tax=Geodermatophilus ruber TaxID=504800 RepID=A0A1I4CWR3_9ACTN|nr:DNA-binding prophage protein [Geodermatophilus ruber]
MTFDDVPDEGLRAACVLVQDVAAALLAQLEDGKLAEVSKRELARRAGVGQATLWPLLAGTLWPRIDTLMRVAQAAGLRISVL